MVVAIDLCPSPAAPPAYPAAGWPCPWETGSRSLAPCRIPYNNVVPAPSAAPGAVPAPGGGRAGTWNGEAASQKLGRGGLPPTPPLGPHPSSVGSSTPRKLPSEAPFVPPVGSYVVASGLQVQVEVNGSIGYVMGHGEDGAVLVSFTTHGNLALLPERLSVVSGPTEPEAAHDTDDSAPTEPEAAHDADDTGSTKSTSGCQSNSTGCCPASPFGEDVDGKSSSGGGTVGPESSSAESSTSSPGCRSHTQSPVSRPSTLYSPQGKDGWSLRAGDGTSEYISPSGKEFAASAGIPPECREWLFVLLKNRILHLSPVALIQAAETITEVLLSVCDNHPFRVFPLAVSSPVADAELRTHTMVVAGVEAHLSYAMADAHSAAQRSAQADIFFGDHMPCLEVTCDDSDL
eukprot:Hpha_TRINITY_DN14290_c0_g1::TRINITY_DN14290_c0_g1_i1::g.22604::m.22604